jgi:hypothetical protein
MNNFKRCHYQECSLCDANEKYFASIATDNTPKELNNIFKKVYFNKIQEFFGNSVSSEIDTNDLTETVEQKCTCDLHTVIMVTGCVCGGK